ncbi:hypothetical protein NP233_g871 [Leucocoprinus birnbaumii]|uniref:Cytochrome P450 n=1 Tax=Leucocoprinus birnbaumii TaxID=56174 RepID=A0AAD5W1J8_9AGAR|nr:hypothetical protein NP233_g871 [Leucocoprinus birnbaumii]
MPSHQRVMDPLADCLSLTTASSAAVLATLTWFVYKTKSAPRYPPGPTKWLPWVGSLFYIPTCKAWEGFERIGKEYDSDILHFQGAGMNLIILNSEQAADDLLNKRSAIYSSRPFMSILDMTGWDWMMAHIPYNSAWREQRKLFQKYLHPTKPEVYQQRFLSVIRDRLIPNLRALESTASLDWVSVFEHAIGSAAMSLVYGIPPSSKGSRFFAPNTPGAVKQDQENPRSLESLIRLAKAAVESLNTAIAEAAIVFDIFPMLRYFPSWFPGLELKEKISKWQKIAVDFNLHTFDVGRSLIEEGKAEESFISKSLEADRGASQSNLDVIRNTAGSMFAAGFDTPLATIRTFIFAMLLHPNVQKRAQQELDQLLATENRRLPEWNDRERLPYLTAVIREVLRWRPIAPITSPHTVTQDDEYKGYFIPKDSTLLTNLWLILRHEQTYGPCTDEFRPERFLDAEGKLNSGIKDPADVIFGFGRRTCPGSHVALYTVFMMAAHILATFDIVGVMDVHGAVRTPSLDWPGPPDFVICAPLPFECKFVPRHGSET